MVCCMLYYKEGFCSGGGGVCPRCKIRWGDYVHVVKFTRGDYVHVVKNHRGDYVHVF